MKKIFKACAMLSVFLLVSSLFQGIVFVGEENVYAETTPQNEYYESYTNEKFAGPKTLGDWTYCMLNQDQSDDLNGSVNPLNAPYIEIIDTTSGYPGQIPDTSKAILLQGNYGTDNGARITSNAGDFRLFTFGVEDDYSDDAGNANFEVLGVKDGCITARKEFSAPNGNETMVDVSASGSEWYDIDEFRIICKNTERTTPNIAIYLDDIWVGHPSRLASKDKNSVKLSSSTVSAADTLTITADGDRQGEAGASFDDERYIPTTWVSTEKGKTGSFTLSEGSYTSSYVPDASGCYTVTASFKKQIWNGSSWVDSNPVVTETKTESVTVNPADSVITPSTSNFDKYECAAQNADIPVTITLKGNILSSIKNGTDTLTDGKDYSVSGNLVTISKSYLSAQSTGTMTLTFNFSAGNSQALTIEVKDSSPIITVKAENPSYGTVSVTDGVSLGNDTYKTSYKKTTIKAVPSTGYNFTGWYNADDRFISSNSTYTVNNNDGIVYTAKFEAVPSAVLTVNVNSTGGISDSSGSVTGVLPNYTYGDKVALTAVANSGYRFVSWTDSTTNKVLSTNLVYSFCITQNTKLTANFVKNTLFTVVFYNNAGQIISTQTVEKNGNAIPPTDPLVPDYTFTGWNKSYTNVTNNLKIYPVFKANPITYKLTVNNGSGSNTYNASTAVTVSAELNGKQFCGWKDEAGNIISYDETYSFIITRNMELTAILSDMPVAAQALVTLDNNVTYYNTTDGYVKMYFLGTFIAPAGYQMLECGFVSVKTNNDPGTNLTLQTPSAKIMKATDLNQAGQVYRIIKTNYGDAFYVRGYMRYKNTATGEIETIYSSNVVRGTKTN